MEYTGGGEWGTVERDMAMKKAREKQWKGRGWNAFSTLGVVESNRTAKVEKDR